MVRMTDDEKRHRRHARQAAKRTAEERAQAGLFVELVRPTTPADEWRRWRRNVARAAEDTGIGHASNALAWLTIHAWKRLALSLLDATTAAEAIGAEARLFERHAGNEYHASLWGNLLRERGVSPGTWCTPTKPEPHDDGGLAERLAAIFPEEPT